jgi:hypothetical protein
MAAITSNVVWRTMQLKDQLNAVLSHCREMLDAFVSNSLRLAAAKAGHARPRQSRCAFPFPPALHAEASDMRFVPLDPDVLSETIPAFYIGRNKAGLWVARDARGRTGGIFLLKSSALSFAQAQSRPQGCATIFPSGRFELDLANAGNRLAPQLASIMTSLRLHFAWTLETTTQRFKRFDVL